MKKVIIMSFLSLIVEIFQTLFLTMRSMTAADGGGDGRLKLNRLARSLSNSEKLLAAASNWVDDDDDDDDLHEGEAAAALADKGEKAAE
jgi:hypothetical protein